MEEVIASTRNLTPGTMIGVAKGDKSLLVANVNGSFYAIGDICTHMGCNISDGSLKGETVECPCHGSVFNLKTGAVINGPAREPEPSYVLKIDGDRIIANL